MKRIIVILALLASAFAQGEAPEQVASMDWLAGSWEGKIWGGTFYTTYSGATGGMVLSASKLVVGGKVQFFEFERFQARGATVFLTPHPNGRAKTPFPMTSYDAAAKKAVFELPTNDYPTRITYHRVADDRLVITLDDPHKKSGKKDVFDLTPSKK